MNRNDVIDVLTVVAAATRRTIGEADVEIWLGIIGGDDKQLALRAVRDHLAERPGVWLEPGHVHQRVRGFVRDRLEREPDHVREARQSALEAKVAEHTAEVAAAFTPRYERSSQRHGVNPLTVRCPWCHAGVGRQCTVPQTNHRPHGGSHPSRIELAAVTADTRQPPDSDSCPPASTQARQNAESDRMYRSGDSRNERAAR